MIIIWIIIHLGINPEKGGNPPRDRSLNGIKIFINGEETVGATKSEIVYIWKLWNIITAEEEINE